MRLTIQNARAPSGGPYEVWPNTLVPEGYISENEVYFVDAIDGQKDSEIDLLIDEVQLEALRPPLGLRARWKWQVGFYVGSASFECKSNSGRPFQFKLVSDPNSEKLSRLAFDRMVSDILDDSSALFALSSFGISLGKGVGDLFPPIARLEFIRSRIDSLAEVIREIDARPIRTLVRMDRITPIESVRTLKMNEFRRAVRSGSTQRTMAGDFLPRRVSASFGVPTTDTAENRFVRMYVDFLTSWVMTMADKLLVSSGPDAETTSKHRRWGKRFQRLALKLKTLSDLPVLRDASGVSTLRAPISPAFSRAPNYSKFRAIYDDLQKGLSRIHGDFLEVPIARTFELYELWAYLRLVRAAARRFNAAVQYQDDLFEKDMARKGVAVLRRKAILHIGDLDIAFQREYHEYWLEKSGLGSFSRVMIPDISFSVKTNVGQLVILDAKYRVGPDLNDAVGSLHMYRDAIVTGGGVPALKAVLAAYIVTPVSYAYSADWRSEKLPKVLFHPQYRSTFKFGAICLRPGMSLDECADVVELVLRDAGIALSERGQSAT